MKTPEIRKLIGQEIEWDTPPDRFRGWYNTRSGIVMEVIRKNIRVESHGMDNWEWLPNMRNIRLKGKNE